MKFKFCGLSRPCDIAWANEYKPDYIGFIFWPKSKRYISKETAKQLKALLSPEIQAVGVFVDAPVEEVAALLNEGIIDAAQLHGKESEVYIRALRMLSAKPVWKAFKIKDVKDAALVNASSADMVLVDSGTGSGVVFDWQLVEQVTRPYLLAGGLNADNIVSAYETLHPYGMDVSSGIETDGLKDRDKMKQFADIAARFR